MFIVKDDSRSSTNSCAEDVAREFRHDFDEIVVATSDRQARDGDVVAIVDRNVDCDELMSVTFQKLASESVLLFSHFFLLSSLGMESMMKLKIVTTIGHSMCIMAVARITTATRETRVVEDLVVVAAVMVTDLVVVVAVVMVTGQTRQAELGLRRPLVTGLRVDPKAKATKITRCDRGCESYEDQCHSLQADIDDDQFTHLFC